MGSQSYLYLVVLPLLVLYLWLEKRWHKVSRVQHVARILLSLIGFGFDSLLESFGLISFSGEQHHGFIVAPLWLALMWFWFVTTFATCYNWLVNRTYLAVLFAAIFGPVAYWGAAQISAITIIQPMMFTLISMIFWSSLFAAIFAQRSWSRVFVHQQND